MAEIMENWRVLWTLWLTSLFPESKVTYYIICGLLSGAAVAGTIKRRLMALLVMTELGRKFVEGVLDSFMGPCKSE